MAGDQRPLGQSSLEEAVSSSCECHGGMEECCIETSSEGGKVLRPHARRQLRSLAFHYLYVAESFNYEIDIAEIEQQFAKEYGVVVEGTDFPGALARGVLEHRERYAAIIEPLLENWRFDRLGCCTRLILYIALWEFEQPHAVASIVINEAVELAKAFAEQDAYRFVNGILDQAKLHYPETLQHEETSEDGE